MNRKDEHLSLAKAFYHEEPNDFDAVSFVHHSLAQSNLAEANLSTNLLGYSLETPFFINAMTGGSSQTKVINQQLATVAKETNLMIASGSVSAALKDPSVADSFTIMRKTYPDGVILANVGAGVTLETAKKAVALLSADGLQIHLNVPQELIMPEGDRSFSHWLESITEIVNGIGVPVVVKEVGFGMSRETVQQLVDLGVKTIDISGRGGTSFSQIENSRRKKREFDYLKTWGQSTVVSLLEANEVNANFELIASGGIKNAYDIFKALSLGARGVGISGMILQTLLNEGVEKTIAKVFDLKEQLRVLYALTGKKQTADLTQNQLIITGVPKDWAQARNIDLTKYSLR